MVFFQKNQSGLHPVCFIPGRGFPHPVRIESSSARGKTFYVLMLTGRSSGFPVHPHLPFPCPFKGTVVLKVFVPGYSGGTAPDSHGIPFFWPSKGHL